MNLPHQARLLPARRGLFLSGRGGMRRKDQKDCLGFEGRRSVVVVERGLASSGLARGAATAGKGCVSRSAAGLSFPIRPSARVAPPCFILATSVSHTSGESLHTRASIHNCSLSCRPPESLRIDIPKRLFSFTWSCPLGKKLEPNREYGVSLDLQRHTSTFNLLDPMPAQNGVFCLDR